MKPELFLLVAMFFTGCGNKSESVSEKPASRGSSWGSFSGPVRTQWEEDGVHMVLLNELRYTDPDGEVWVAPAGSRVNGASIPRAFWSIIGGPFDGKYRNASVLHDVAYGQQTRPWRDVDRMFYNAMRCSGVGAVTAKTMYYALLKYGRHWDHPRAAAVERPGGGAEAPPAERVTSVTPAEVGEVRNWIEENQPDLREIEGRATGRQ